MSGGGQLGPISLRISVTDRCQFRCFYCMPSEGVSKDSRHDILRFEEIVRLVRAAKSCFALSKVHITGGEPLLRSGLTSLVAMLAGEGVGDLALTTNGRRLGDMAFALKQAGLRRVNVSLDSINARRFAQITRGGRLEDVLEGIEAARVAGLAPVKLNTVVMRGSNDTEVTDLARWALERGCPIRFLELMPIGCAKPMFKEMFVPASEVRQRLRTCFTLTPLPRRPGSSSRCFLASDAAGREGVIGFIAPQTQPFCSGCRRLRLTSTGQVLACLAREEGPNVRELLRSNSPTADEALAKMLSAELMRKSGRVGFTGRAMVKVGG